MRAKYWVLGFFALGLGALIYENFKPSEQDPHSVQRTEGDQGAPLAKVIVPDLSDEAELGRAAFEANCATCHGVNAAGQDGVAPPLVHKIYEPNHHGDMAFQLAAKNGVRAHHWRFGNMPPVPGISENEITLITNYIRELQRANGIF